MDEQNTILSTAEAARKELTLPPMPEPPAPPATVNVVDIHFRSGGNSNAPHELPPLHVEV